MELEQGVCQEQIALIFSRLQRQTKQIGEDSPAAFPETGGWVAGVRHEIFSVWEIERRPRGASQHKAAP
ncbi:hypothetical protein, partial [Pseudomonas asiatica]|uniref:hypothetical protein n=1 Tax=Pseudomonas asiatica TaxID=2219225 RepID=UPI003BA28177